MKGEKIISNTIDDLNEQLCKAMAEDKKARLAKDAFAIRCAEAKADLIIQQIISEENKYAAENELVWYLDRWITKEEYNCIHWNL